MKHLFIALLSCAFFSVSAQTTPARPAPIVSPQTENGQTTFRLRAPNAKEVILDIEGISKETMQKNEAGVWSFTKSLEPDVYDYAFVVDGLQMTDPANPVVKPGYQQATQSLAHVPGPATISWEVNDATPHGVVSHHEYKSAAVGDSRDFYVYLPPNYNPSRKEPYPVLYLLHGATGNALSWIKNGQANIILDNLINQGKAKPMIMVNTLGYGGNEKYGAALFNEVMPVVQKTYNASKDRNQQAIAGLSMGGGTALYTGLNNLDRFAYVAGFSSAVGLPRTAPVATASINQPATPPAAAAPVNLDGYAKVYPKLDSKANAQLKLLWIACGKADFLYETNNNFKSWLTSKNVKFVNHETEGGHTFMVWRRNLTDFAPLIFQ